MLRPVLFVGKIKPISLSLYYVIDAMTHIIFIVHSLKVIPDKFGNARTVLKFLKNHLKRSRKCVLSARKIFKFMNRLKCTIPRSINTSK